MNRKSTSTYVEDTVGLLVEHFGVGRVRAALAKVSNGGALSDLETQPRPRSNRIAQHLNPSLQGVLEQVQQKDREKHRLLTDFYFRLRDKTVLPESQDIRHFAQRIGLKEIEGKSRKDMVPKLIRFLLDRPTERIRADIAMAANISEQQRKQGYSVLTDKILAGMPRAPAYEEPKKAEHSENR